MGKDGYAIHTKGDYTGTIKGNYDIKVGGISNSIVLGAISVSILAGASVKWVTGFDYSVCIGRSGSITLGSLEVNILKSDSYKGERFWASLGRTFLWGFKDKAAPEEITLDGTNTKVAVNKKVVSAQATRAAADRVNAMLNDVNATLQRTETAASNIKSDITKIKSDASQIKSSLSKVKVAATKMTSAATKLEQAGQDTDVGGVHIVNAGTAIRNAAHEFDHGSRHVYRLKRDIFHEVHQGTGTGRHAQYLRGQGKILYFRGHDDFFQPGQSGRAAQGNRDVASGSGRNRQGDRLRHGGCQSSTAKSWFAANVSPPAESPRPPALRALAWGTWPRSCMSTAPDSGTTPRPVPSPRRPRRSPCWT